MPNIDPPPPARNRPTGPALGLQLTAADLPEPAFSAWLINPAFQCRFRQAHAMGGRLDAA